MTSFRRAVVLFVVNAVNYLLLVWNFRAIAQGHMGTMLATDATIAALSFVAIRRIGEANGPAEFAGYTLGALAGSTVALLLAPHVE